MLEDSRAVLDAPENRTAAAQRDWPDAGRWPVVRKGNPVESIGAALDKMARWQVFELAPFHLIGSCDVYQAPDGRDQALRNQWSFVLGGAGVCEAPSLMLFRTAGVFSKRLVTQYVDPGEWDAFELEIIEENGHIRAEVQLRRSSTPTLRFGWWAKEPHRDAVLAAGRVFSDSLKTQAAGLPESVFPNVPGLRGPRIRDADTNSRPTFRPELLTGLEQLGHVILDGADGRGLQPAIQQLEIALDRTFHAFWADELADHLKRVEPEGPWVWLGASRFLEFRLDRTLIAGSYHERLAKGALLRLGARGASIALTPYERSLLRYV